MAHIEVFAYPVFEGEEDAGDGVGLVRGTLAGCPLGVHGGYHRPRWQGCSVGGILGGYTLNYCEC